MNQYTFDYPAPIQTAKNLCKLFMILSVPLFVVMIIRNTPSQYNSVFDYYMAFAWPVIFFIVSLLFSGSWPAFSVSNDSIDIEFAWFKLPVPWADIIEIEHVGSKRFGVSVVTTKENRLTIFHRFYSFYTIGSSKPGFHIRSQISGYKDLITMIEKRGLILKHSRESVSDEHR